MTTKITRNLVDQLQGLEIQVRRGMTRQNFEAWTTYFRPEFEALPDAKIRERALYLFSKVEGASFVVERHPALREEVLFSTLHLLVEHLRDSDRKLDPPVMPTWRRESQIVCCAFRP